MSRLLTSIRGLCQKSTQHTLDLILGNSSVSACLKNSESPGEICRREWLWSESSVNHPVAYLEPNWLTEVVDELSVWVGPKSPTIRIIMPDHLLEHVWMDMESIPKRKQPLMDIVSWRLREEFHIEPERYAFDFCRADGHGLSVVCLGKEFKNSIEQIFIGNNLLISGYMPLSIYRLEDAVGEVKSRFFIYINAGNMVYGRSDSELCLRLYYAVAQPVCGIQILENFLHRARREFLAVKMRDAIVEKDVFILGDNEVEALAQRTLSDFSIRRCRLELDGQPDGKI